MKLRSCSIGIALVCFILGFFFLQQGAARADVYPVAPREEAVTPNIEEKALVEQKFAEGGEQPAISLEQAIRIAREAFEVPAELNQFSSGFNQSAQDSFWDLRWYRASMEGGEMSVRVNAYAGEIWSMYKWLPSAAGEGYRGLPAYSREQAQARAAAFVQRLHPERFGQTRLQPGSDYVPPLFMRGRGPMEYNFYYARMIEGVIYANNSINVAVNGDTGEIIRFDLSWEDARDFPSPADKISQEQAEQIFRSETPPELYYSLPYVSYGREAPVKLVYKLPEAQGQVMIDALTGELLNRETNYYYSRYDGAGGGGGIYALEQPEIELTPAEVTQVDELQNLLSLDEALEKAKSAVGIPGGYILNNSRLEQDYRFKDIKTWYFNWRPGDYADPGGMEVSIDAANGDLVSFYFYYDYYDDTQTPVVKIGEEEARRIAEDFIRKNQPDRWEQLVFNWIQPATGPIGPTKESQPRAYAVDYTRLVNGVKFPDNGFHLVINSATGQINSYRMSWWNVKFPAPEGVIAREAAADKYLQEAPLSVGYMRLYQPRNSWNPNEESKVHLVYHQANIHFAMLDAFTGQTLDSQGNAVYPMQEKGKFSDLQGHPAREAVELLADAGIVDGGNGRFRPDEAMTQAELIVMLVKSFYQMPPIAAAGEEPWYQSHYDKAGQMGIIQAGEKPDPDKPVNREFLARLTIHAMDLYKVARLSDIYTLNFPDADDISPHLRGHAVLSVALGLIEPVEGKFEPKAVVTRGEAAETLVRFLKNGK